MDLLDVIPYEKIQFLNLFCGRKWTFWLISRVKCTPLHPLAIGLFLKMQSAISRITRPIIGILVLSFIIFTEYTVCKKVLFGEQKPVYSNTVKIDCSLHVVTEGERYSFADTHRSWDLNKRFILPRDDCITDNIIDYYVNVRRSFCYSCQPWP